MSVRSALLGGGVVAVAWVLAGTVPGAWQAGAVVGRAVTAGGEIVAVVDADTVAVGQDGAERLRLAGFDAPEIYSARCPRERELGLVAAGRLMARPYAGGRRRGWCGSAAETR